MLQTVCCGEVLCRSSVFEWLKRLKDGCEDHQDDPRSGCLSTLEMQKQSQMTMKWRHEIADGLSEKWRVTSTKR
jgi:hypothetical protein